MFSQVVLAAMLLALGTGTSAACATDDHPRGPIEGGVVAETKDADYELVITPHHLFLYVRAHAMPADIFEIEAKVTLFAGKAKQVVNMTRKSGRFEATGTFQVGSGTKIVAVVTRPDTPASKVRFTLK